MNKFIGLLLLLCSESLAAQHIHTLDILNDETHQPLPNVTVTIIPAKRNGQPGTTSSSGAATILSDSTGIAALPTLSPGKYILHCSSTGFKDRETTLTVRRDSPDTTIIILDPSIETMADVVVVSTRTNQLLKNVPITVQVIDKEDIEEGTGQSPANIRELLTELSGTQLQQTSATSGNVTIRLQGLDGRYTQLLKDGFPLFSGFSGSLSLLQVPPLDLRQVEVIKGAGSALYGGDAIAGIINLISRTPDTTRRLDAILNQTQRGGTDFGGFYSKRNHRTGITVMVTASRQNPADINNDGFTDLPHIRQGSFAPTFFRYLNDSTALRLGVNLSSENRTGGDLSAVEHGADSFHSFLQQNHTNRDYYQLSITHKAKDNQTFSLKNSIGYFYRSITQITGILPNGPSFASTGFSGAQVSSFTEASYGINKGAHQVITGLDWITDQFRPSGVHTNLGYIYNTAGVFAQDDWVIGKKATLETGIRADVIHTLYLLPRVALLYKILPRFSARIGGGLAYKLPTIFNAQGEEEGYQQVYPIASSVQAERSASANVSLNYHGQLGDDIGIVIDQNFYYTRLSHALIPRTDSLQRGWLYYINAPGLATSKGFETNARFTLDDLTLQLGYTFTDARQNYLKGQPPLPLSPQSRLSASLVYESEPHWKAGIEGFYTASQYLDNGQKTPSFRTCDFMVQYTLDHCALLLNLENFTDTRQSKFGPLFTGTPQNPVFNEIYAPLEGRIESIAFRYSW
ncbi:MAG TPA: TonB-dependent receptor [Puia sp.]|jgi:outer membrane cobalamin receptor